MGRSSRIRLGLALLALACASVRAMPPEVDPHAPARGASNGYYEVFQFTSGVVNGGFGIATGPLHVITQTTLPPAPMPSPVSVVRVGTVMNGFAIRDYDTRRAYLVPSLPAPPDPGWTNVVVAFTESPVLTPIGDAADPVGWAAHWDLSPLGATVAFDTEVFASGTSLASSAAVMRFALQNVGSVPVRLGMRLRLDPDPVLESGTRFPGFGSAGPGLALRPPCEVDEPLLSLEQSWLDPSQHSWTAYGTMQPSMNPWFYWSGASIAGPVDPALPQPTFPDVLQFAPEDTADLADLRHAVFAIEHAVPPRIIAGDYGGTSALNYLWGATAETAIVLGPGERREFVALSAAWLDYPVSADLDAPSAVECVGDEGEAPLDASGSSSIDGTPITVAWLGDASTDVTPLAATLGVARLRGLGDHGVTARALVGPYMACSVATIRLVDTRPPVVAAPAFVEGRTSEGARCQAPIVLRASAGDACSGSGVVLTNDRGMGGADASGQYPLGDTDVTFRAVDPSGNVGTAVTRVHVIDDVPPQVILHVDPASAWPPHHGFLDVHVDVAVTDDCDSDPEIRLLSVVSSEAADGRGDGATSVDVADAEWGSADVDFRVRAERSGRGPGRAYVATYEVIDDAGNTAEASTTIEVPHDRRAP